jgi:lysophospholipase L1-like esterase
MPRHTFRPCLSDRLEERVVLSGTRALAIQAATSFRVAKIGAMGDSLTDEYRFDSFAGPTQKNWVEILARTRQLRFGPYSLASRGEPRNAGYAFNWARSDATSSDMVANQLPGLSQQVRKGQVNLVSIAIGANDFLHYASTISPITPPSVADVNAALAKIESRAEENLTTAVRTIMAANPNVRMTLANLPNLSQLPAVATIDANPLLKPLIDAFDTYVVKYNNRIAALAAEEPSQIAVIDLHGLNASIQAQAAANGKISVGSQTIDARTPGNDPTDLYLADGVHIGTVGQGLVANLFVSTVDTAFHLNIRPLKAAEILRQARIR